MFSVDVANREIYIYDELGPAYWGLIDSQMVIEALSAIGKKDVTIRLNTPGGSVDEGIAIYNALARHSGKVTTIVDSLAASMGSYLLQAGSERLVAKNAMVMIHDPWSIAIGNSSDFRKAADVLDKYAARMLPDYATRSGKSEEDMAAIMRDESWYTGKEAVDAGFADAVFEEEDVEPMLAGLYRNASKIPESLRAVAASQLNAKPQFPKRTNAIARTRTRDEWKAYISSQLKNLDVA